VIQQTRERSPKPTLFTPKKEKGLDIKNPPSEHPQKITKWKISLPNRHLHLGKKKGKTQSKSLFPGSHFSIKRTHGKARG